MKDLTTYDEHLNEASTLKIKIKDLNFGEHAKDGKIKIQSMDNADAKVSLTDQERVDDWIKSFTKAYGNTGTIEINFKLPWFDHYKIVGNTKYDKSRNASLAAKAAMLKSWGTTN